MAVLKPLFAGILLSIVVCSFGVAEELTKDFAKVPAKGQVTMIDLGAHKCIPCKMMAPILVKLDKAYQGKAAIVFIDVWQNQDQAKRFGIRGIPTQIFFDQNGQEVYRHTGFLDEKSIESKLNELGVPAPATPSDG
jgi:thioredoxin 1